MASLLKSGFGSNTETQEQKENNNNTNNNNNNPNSTENQPIDNNPSNQPEPQQLSKQELAEKRLAKLQHPIIPQPSTSQSTESISPSTKMDNNNNNDNNKDDMDIDELSEEIKTVKMCKMEDMKSNNNDKSSKNNVESKQISFEYLSVMYILEIRHKDLSEYNEHIINMNKFSDLLKNMNTFCMIDQETPISSSTIEAIFIDRFQKGFKIYKSSFKYLLKSYQRCIDFTKRIESYWTVIVPQQYQLQIITNIETAILTFCGILLSTPDLTTMEDFIKSQQEFQHILCSPVKGRDFPKNFLQRLFAEIDDDSINDVLEKPMNLIKATSLNVLRSNFTETINALIKLSQIEKFALYVMDKNKPFWIPNDNENHIIQIKQEQKTRKINAKTIILESIMGGLLNLSYETTDILGLFNKLTMDGIKTNPQIQQQIQSSFSEYRLIMNELQNGVYCIFNNFIRIKNKKCRENVLKLLSYFIYINLDRGKMRFDHLNVSNDGFMLNLNYVLLKLCDPIIKKNMLNKINSFYFLINKTSNYMTWEDSTRLSCNTNQVKILQNKLYHNNNDDDVESKSNDDDNKQISFGFTTEIFCLTLEALHLGFSCIYNELSRLQIHIDRLRREARTNPVAAFMINFNIQRLEKRLLAQIAHLMNERFMLNVGRFYGFFCRWLLYLSLNKINGKELLSVIPEYYIEDMSRFFRLFLTERGFILLIERGQSPFNREEVIKCLIYLMSESTPIYNIYGRACLCEVLLYFLPSKVLQSQRNKNIIWNKYEFELHEFNKFESCKNELVSTLLILYTDVERTGSPGSYYEKFKFRTIITRILKFLFCYEIHQNNLIKFYQSKQEQFINFLNMLINDLIYTLDEGFDGLTEIRQIETNQDENSQNTENNINQIENVSELKDTIRHYMNLANESIELLQYVCYHTPSAFMNNLILPRIAILVSVYLDRLANGSELRVRGNLREDYNFNAKFLLTTVVNIFNKLCDTEKHKQLFLDSIVDDEAHFRYKSYKKAINVLRKKQLINNNQINLFEKRLQILLNKFQEKKNIEYILGDIPNKYLDPIMQTLMTDPVILKSNNNDNNKYVMDRKVIERHLMNNPNNPFNREPLTKNDLIPHTKLKNEINEWVQNTLETHKNKTKNNNQNDNDEQKQQ